MPREGDIVEAHAGFGRGRVALGELGADGRRPVEEGRGDEVEEEAEHVDDGEVEGGADGRAPPDVEQRLRVEGDGPAQEAGARRSGGMGFGEGVGEATDYIQPHSLG